MRSSRHLSPLIFHPPPPALVADVNHQYDTERFEFTKSIRCRRCIKRTQLFYIVRFVPRFGQRHYDVDVIDQTVSAHESRSNDVQSVFTVSGGVATGISEIERET